MRRPPVGQKAEGFAFHQHSQAHAGAGGDVSYSLLIRQFGASIPPYRLALFLRVRIPEHPAGHSDNIRPPKPEYPATLV